MTTAPRHTQHPHVEKDGFRLRGHEMARIDAFSDVVFGFALTLLVVSLEVPKTFAELQVSLRGFVPFAICFTFLMLVWHAHYRFFRRFGTHDSGTIVINAALLFVILFYVYPLKFLFTVFSNWVMGIAGNSFDDLRQVRELMLLYGLGFTAIYLLLAALYWNGLRQRAALGLNPLEIVLTRSYIGRMAGTALVGIVSCILALAVPERWAGIAAGWTYLLISPVHLLVRRITRGNLQRERASAALAARETPA